MTTESTHCHCGEPSVQGGLCYKHHIEFKKTQWLDNSDVLNPNEDKGIVLWAHEVMPEYAYNKTPQFHKELFYNLLRLYDPTYRNKYERLYEWIGFRESAKSTLETLLTSYILAHNGETIRITVDGVVKQFPIEERTVVIISETAGSAEEFTVRIRDAFLSSERLRYYYRVSIQDAVDSITGQMTRTSFKFNDCHVQAVGSGQMIRGKVKGASRPTMIIADDIYSQRSTLTEETRNRTKWWWNKEVMNSIDNLKGKVIVLGTIVHEDTVIVELENNPMWTTKKVAVMGKIGDDGKVNMELFHEFVNKYIKVDWDTSTCVLPFDEIEEKEGRIIKQREFFDKVQKEKDWELQWPERIDLYLLAIKYKEAVYNNSVPGFYQEYFHLTQAPHEKRFRTDMFLTAPKYELKKDYGHTWIKFEGKDEWNACNIEFGVDIAGTGGDDAVITPVIALYDYRVIVAPQVIGKWSLRDDLSGTESDLRRYKVADVRAPIGKVGLVDELFRIAVRYMPSVIKVGIAGEEELILREIQRVFAENRIYTISIQPRPQTVREGNKIARIAATLLPFYETRMVYHTPGLSKLEYQLEYLGKTKHDDCADCLECALFNLSFPEKLSIDFFEGVNTPTEKRNIHSLPKAKEFNLQNNWMEYI